MRTGEWELDKWKDPLAAIVGGMGDSGQSSKRFERESF